MTAYVAFLRLELSDAMRSKWLAFSCALYASLAGAFVYFGLQESTVLGFTGLSRVLLNLTSALIILFPLVVLIGTHAAVVRARTSGFCELMLTQPVKRSTWFLALLSSRLLVLVGPLVLFLLVAAFSARFLEAEPELLAVAAQSLLTCASLVLAFVGLGLLISAFAKTTERAMVLSLLTFVFSAALHDVLLISALLKTALPPQVVFGLAALNPTEAARVSILSSVDPELSALGPVGFWLANSLGPKLAFALGVGWPALLGSLCCAVAARHLGRADVVL